MKIPAIFLLLLLSASASAQKLTGLLMGELTRMPLAHATVSSGGQTALSNPFGVFSINTKPGDSVRVTCAGYAYLAFMPKAGSRADTLVIYMQPMSYVLNEVTIRAIRDRKADSLYNRRAFANVFAYKGTTLNDVMIKRDPGAYVPYNYIDAPNNTTQIVGFDVLRLVSYLSKKTDKTAKLKKTLLRSEVDNYVDQRFGKEKVASITALKGDSLRTFMDRYRPAPDRLKKMTDYEIVNYIKKNYAEFVK
ncbi:hypothetical protein HQ865_02405 [Mucilaginibacter mali]|uniref:Carboxypeptidase-like regulatory domain-containing protein n=1 Tax=Mucilaginibacter mali TaxID=2740462 RepID=A0A7D4TLX9_9SPHI|nr:hypothetical protein [Mucilaginibacter mali]QKJ28654.1 hypothetical protein HQ865_02405 [Mucilaginibacter mali]